MYSEFELLYMQLGLSCYKISVEALARKNDRGNSCMGVYILQVGLIIPK